MLAREIIFEPLEEVLIDLLGVCVWAALCVKSVCSALVFDWSQLLALLLSHNRLWCL